MSSEMHFDTPFSFEKSIHIIEALCTKLLGDDHGICRMVRERRWSDLLDHPVDYGTVGDVSLLLKERQALAFFQKNASIPLGIDKDQVAFEKFIQAESKCLEMNRLLVSTRTPLYKEKVRAGLYFKVMRKVAEILGDFPGIDAFDYSFGPGANVGLSRFTSARRKLSTEPTCTANAWKYLLYLQEAYPHWDLLKKAVPAMHGKLSFVSKDAKTNRSIVIEPLINTYLQKGVGEYIRSRLRKFGVNLNDQSLNQQGARVGSLDGSLATIDLSSASDTISREVVAALLPIDWWLFLDDIRTHDVVTPSGEVIHLQKFSSMGNGFTFELESLIFFAIAQCVCPKGSRINVYGDDIVIPTEYYGPMCQALEQFGFSVNLKKSFWQGKFRESCGKDFFDGVDIRPCYVKDNLSVKELFRLHNFFIRNFRCEEAGLVLSYIPKRFRIFGPDGFGDGHLLGDHSHRVFRKARGWAGYVFRTFASKPLRRCEPLIGDYVAILYLLSRKGTSVEDDYGASRPVPIWDWLASFSAPISDTLYQERNRNPKYRLTRIYTWG